MIAASPALSQLTATERAELESKLIDFDLRWDADRLAARARELPAEGAFRRTALTEMIKIDLERHWQCGHRVGVEYYLETYPELSSATGPPMELVEAEIAVRGHFGAPPDEAELHSRFPQCREHLSLLLQTCSYSQAQLLTVSSGPSAAGGGQSDAPRELSGAFGRYHIRSTLGRGGMGSVYLADDLQLGRAVALKVPHTFSAGDATARERFRREGRAAAALDHPNLCRVYDVGEHDGTPYLTMAFVEGRPLGDPADGTLTDERIAAIIRKVALALEYAHSRAVIHRDLKPSNILIDSRGEPVVTDFGLARREDVAAANLTRDGVPLGTPAYMSPEQVSGRTEAIGPPSDIFSLGIVLYQLLTGQLPFRGGVGEVMVRIAVEEPSRPSEVRPGVDPRLEAACLKALAKAPADRFASMGQFAAALDVEPRVEPQAESPAARPPRRTRAALIGVAFLVVTAAVLIVRCEYDKPPKGQQPENGTPKDKAPEGAQPVIPAPARKVEAQMAILRGHDYGVTAVALPGKDWVVSADEYSVRTWDRQTGKQLSDAGPKPNNGWKRLGIAIAPDGQRFVDHFFGPVELQDARTGEALLKEDETGMHNGPKAFSANGKRIALGTRYVFGETATVVWDIDANKTFKFDKYGNAEGIWAVALTADGKRAASMASEPGDGVRVWEVDSGKELRHWPKLAATALAFTPDGKFVLTGNVLGALVLRDPATGEEVGKFEGHTDRITGVAFSADGTRLASASADGTARVWAVDTRREFLCLKGHTGAVRCVAISADGSAVATGGEDKTVRVWTIR